MSIGRGGTNSGRARRLRKGKARRPFPGDQLERGADQRFLEIAVVIAALTPGVPRPAHVKGLYMSGTRAPPPPTRAAFSQPARTAFRGGRIRAFPARAPMGLNDTTPAR